MVPAIAPLRISVPYVSGSKKDTGCKKTGRLESGTKRPHRNSIGKRKKFEKVCASKICFADTAISKPIRVDVIAISSTASNTTAQFTTPKFTKKAAKITGTKALNIPNTIAPVIFANTIVLRLIGASSNLSNECPLRSKVIVTANMEVVPKSTLMAIRPGSNSIRFPSGERISCINVQDKGKMIPQLIFGGLR